MILVQISDTHIDDDGALVYGHFDTSLALENAVKAIQGLDVLPDLVLHTGDIASHGTLSRYRRFREIMSDINAPLAVIPGNHDDRETLREAFSDASLFPASGEFLHYVIEDMPVRVICCDSVIAGEVPGEMCPERLAWLDQRLCEAPDRPTVVALHHPPFSTGLTGASSQGLVRGGVEFADIISRHPQILAVLAGHIHRPITTRFAGTVAFTAPSTCYPFGLNTGPARELNVTHEPPGLAVHLWLPNATTSGSGLVSHVLPVGDWAPPVTLLREGVLVLGE